MRFHLNPNSGNPGQCRAKEGNCPYGDESVHFDSREKASAFYESLQNLPPVRLQKSRAVNYDKETRLLKPEVAKKMKPRGVYCPRCKKPLEDASKLAAMLNDVFAEVKCSCGKYSSIESVVVRIEPDNPSYKFLNKEAVKEAVWYHATDKEDWLESQAKGEFEAHVGTLNAAMDRGITEYAPPVGRENAFYMYEVRLAPDAKVADKISSDTNQSSLVGTTSDVSRYVNRWEDSASISLAVRSHKLEIVGKRKIEPEEARNHKSFYNVEPYDVYKDEDEDY